MRIYKREESLLLNIIQAPERSFMQKIAFDDTREGSYNECTVTYG